MHVLLVHEDMTYLFVSDLLKSIMTCLKYNDEMTHARVMPILKGYDDRPYMQ